MKRWCAAVLLIEPFLVVAVSSEGSADISRAWDRGAPYFSDVPGTLRVLDEHADFADVTAAGEWA